MSTVQSGTTTAPSSPDATSSASFPSTSVSVNAPSSVSPPSSADRFLRLVVILNEKHFFAKELAHLIDLADYDTLAKALVYVSHEGGVSLALIRSVVAGEFEMNIRNPANILRGNSVASKMMGAFCRKVGQEWLSRYAGDSVRVVSDHTSLDMEIDPARLGPPAAAAALARENEQRLRDFSLKILTDLTLPEHVREMPRGIRALAAFVAEYARMYASDRLLPLVGGFLFLRFFSPSIVTPETYGIVPESRLPSRQARRNLTLITKVLQNLSNDVLFGAKEQYMMPMNSFIEEHCETMRSFLNDVIVDPLAGVNADPFSMWADCRSPARCDIDVTKLDLSHVRFLHRMLFIHRSRLLERLHEVASASGGLGAEDYCLEEELFRLLDEMGPPAEDLRSMPRQTLADPANVSFLVAPIRSGHITVPKKIKPRKRYWVVLTENFLYYFMSSEDTVPHKAVSMDEVFLPEDVASQHAVPSPPAVAAAASEISPGPDRRTRAPKEEFFFAVTLMGKSKNHIVMSAAEVSDWVRSILELKRRRALARPQVKLGALEIRMRNFLSGRNVHYEFDILPLQLAPDGVHFPVEVRSFGTSWTLQKSYRDVLYFHHQLTKHFPKRIFPAFPNAEGFDILPFPSAGEGPGPAPAATAPAAGASLLSGSTVKPGIVRGGIGGGGAAAAGGAQQMKLMQRSSFFFKFFRSYLSEVCANLHVSQHSAVLEFFEVSSVFRAIQTENMEQLEYLQSTGGVSLDAILATCAEPRCAGMTPLHIAVTLEKEAPCRYMLSRMQSVDAVDAHGDSALMLAVRQHAPAFVLNLLDAGASVTLVDAQGRTPLHVAVEEDLLSIAEYFVERSFAPLDALDREQRSPLYRAVQIGRLEFVKFFLRRGHSVSTADARGGDLLGAAVESGNLEIAEILLQAGAFNIGATSSRGVPVLHIAAEGGHVRLIDLMLRQKTVEVRVTNSQGLTALMVACRKGFTDVVRHLVAASSSAHLDARSPSGRSALHFAVEANSLSVVLLLLDAGASVDATDGSGETALHLAVRGQRPELVQLLGLRGAAMSLPNAAGRTPLHEAAMHADVPMIELLVRLGAALDLQDSEGHSALHLAVWAQKAAVVAALLRAGARPNLVELSLRETPLHIAAGYATKDTVVPLLQAGAKIYATRADGCVPLHRAAQEGNLSAAAALLSFGSALNAQNRDGCTPVHLAVIAGHDALALLLVRAGADAGLLNKDLHSAAHYARPKLRQQLAEAAAQGPPDLDGALDGDRRSTAAVTLVSVHDDPTLVFPCTLLGGGAPNAVERTLPLRLDAHAVPLTYSDLLAAVKTLFGVQADLRLYAVEDASLSFRAPETVVHSSRRLLDRDKFDFLELQAFATAIICSI